MYNYLPAINYSRSEKQIKEIKQIIKKNKLTCLTHFTRMDYLKSILQNGILPASILLHNRTFDTVHRNSITLPPEWSSMVSLNLSFPDYKLFSDLNNHKPSDWVILLIDIRVLFDFPCYFFPERAVDLIDKAPLPNQILDDYRHSTNLKAIFTDREDIKRKELDIPPWYPTDPTTEILSSFPISPSYITQIFFHSDYKFNQWVLHNTVFAMSQDRNRWSVGLEYFSPRSDYPFWKTKR